MASSSVVELRKVWCDAGVPQDLQQFIEQAGVSSIAVFSRIGITEDEVRTRLVQPWAEKQKGDVPSPEDALKIAVAEATVLAAWDCANKVRLSELNQATSSIPTVVPSPGQSTSSTPTTLRPGVWDEQVKKFENMWTPPRVFPQKILIGSEVVLARLLYEATVTRLFTPLRLGELLKNRAYASSGLVNQLAMKRSEDQVLGWKRRGETAEFVPTQPQYDPRSSRTVVDALEAVKWAYTWAGYGSDLDADRLTDPFFEVYTSTPKRVGRGQVALRCCFVGSVSPYAKWCTFQQGGG